MDLINITGILTNTPKAVACLLFNLPEYLTAVQPSEGKWCIKEIVGHLIEEDKRDFAGRIKTIFEADSPLLSISDQDEVVKSRQDCNRPISELLDEFAQTRSEGVEFISRLKDVDLQHTGVHPRLGNISVSNLLSEWAYHDLHHLKQICGIIQFPLWNTLGNLQQFYQP